MASTKKGNSPSRTKKVTRKSAGAKEPGESPRLVRGGRRKSKASVLERLSPTEASRVLFQLVEQQPSLRAEVEALATEMVTAVDAASVAAKVVDSLTSLAIFDIGDRGGPQPFGYVEPIEVAWELLGEAVKPFCDQAIRLAELGHSKAACEVLRGILSGLYAIREYERDDALLGWVPDFPEAAAVDALSGVEAALGVREGKLALVRQAIADMDDWPSLDARVGSRR